MMQYPYLMLVVTPRVMAGVRIKDSLAHAFSLKRMIPLIVLTLLLVVLLYVSKSRHWDWQAEYERWASN